MYTYIILILGISYYTRFPTRKKAASHKSTHGNFTDLIQSGCFASMELVFIGLIQKIRTLLLPNSLTMRFPIYRYLSQLTSDALFVFLFFVEISGMTSPFVRISNCPSLSGLFLLFESRSLKSSELSFCAVF